MSVSGIVFRSLAVAMGVWVLVYGLATTVTSVMPRSYAATARVKLSETNSVQNYNPYQLQNDFARMESPEFLKQVGVAADLKTRWKDSLTGDDSLREEQIAGRLRGAMMLRPVRNTTLFDITFYNEAPSEAADIANAIASVYCSQSGAKILEKAAVPTRPIRPNPFLNLAIGVIGGGILGLIAGGLTALYLAFRKPRTPGSSRREEAQTEPQNQPNAPAARVARRNLKIVAALFIFVGLWSLMDMLFSSGFRNMSVAPGAFCLPIGIGLLRFREFCRRMASWCVWANCVFAVIMLGWIFGKAFGAFESRNVIARIIGQPIDSGFGAMLTFLLFLAQAVLLPWMILVLLNRDVKAACRQPRPEPWPLLEWGTLILVLLIMLGAVRLPWPNRWQTGVYFSDLKPAKTSATNETTFGPVIEREIPDPATNVACVLDFETGQLLSPPSNVSLASLASATALDAALIRWLRDAGGDAIVTPDGSLRFLEGVVLKPTVRGSATTWDDLSPGLVVSGIEGLAEKERAGSAFNPEFHIATLREPVAMEFTTRERSMGVIQIMGATTNPRGVKIRYKLIRSTSATSDISPTSAETWLRKPASAHSTATSGGEPAYWTDHLRLNQPVGTGGSGLSRYGDDAFGYETLFDGKACSVTVRYRKEREAEYRVQIEEKGGRRRMLDAGLRSTRENGRYAEVEEKKMMDRAEFDRIAAFVLQKKTRDQPVGRLGFNPVIERTVELSVPPEWFWFDLEIGQSVTCGWPEGEHKDPATEGWTRAVGADFRVVEEGHVGIQRGLDAGDGGCLLIPVKRSEWDSLSADRLPSLTAILSNRVSGRLLFSERELPATLYFKTREGSEGLLQITRFTTEAPLGAKIRYKLVQTVTATSTQAVLEKNAGSGILSKSTNGPGLSQTGMTIRAVSNKVIVDFPNARLSADKVSIGPSNTLKATGSINYEVRKP